jgi:hypothetical protein
LEDLESKTEEEVVACFKQYPKLKDAAEQLQEQSVSGEDIVGFANTNAEWGQFAKAIFGTTSALEGLCLRKAIKRVKDNAAAELTAGETTPATKKQKLGRCRADLIPLPPPQTDSFAH